jgi:periplasmic divalent cation tolerance protein
MSMYSTVLIMTPDLESATKIAESVVQRRLAACANFFPISSIYRWNDGVVRESEYALTLKVRTGDFDEVKTVSMQLHPDKVPCIVRYDIAAGLTSYLDWIRESTERPKLD